MLSLNTLRVLQKFQIKDPFVASQIKRFRPPQPIKKFYRKVDIAKTENDVWNLKLDNKILKTPNKNALDIKNEPLANLIQTEWKSQKVIIAQHSMHFTALMNTLIDNPIKRSKYHIVNEIVESLQMDTILFRDEEESKLGEMQKEQWGPIVKWFENEFGCKIPYNSGSIVSPEIPTESLNTVKDLLLSFNEEIVLGLSFGIGSVRSVILPLAVFYDKLTVKEAVKLSRLELEYQLKYWARVEWAHDLEYNDTLARLSAGILFASLHHKDKIVPFNQKMVVSS